MKLTRNLKKYVVFSVIWSVAFFSTLHWALFNAQERWPVITATAITYGLGFGAVGWLLSRSDPANKTRLNLCLAYYSVSNLTSLLVGGLWIVFFRSEEWPSVVAMAIVFAFFSIIAYSSSKNTVKGIDKSKLFK